MSTRAREIAARIEDVQSRIIEAARRAGREPSDVLLVAVSKTHGLDAVEAAYNAGLRHFGENRIEEGGEKIPAARSLLPADVVWHMIGHIQSRKTGDVPGLFNWVHSVDRLKIARRLSDAALAEGRVLEVLLELNVSGEESKQGYGLAGWPEDSRTFAALRQDIEVMAQMPGIRVQGLMTMAPYGIDPEDARPVFRRLRAVREALCNHFPAMRWLHLSMGMTADYEVAVEEGATIVRVGTAIFGEREGY
jgi:pyridoxal phosphate enzyme (YggS family)